MASTMPLPSREVSMTTRMSATALDCTTRYIELDGRATLDTATHALTETVIGLDSASLNTTVIGLDTATLNTVGGD